MQVRRWLFLNNKSRTLNLLLILLIPSTLFVLVALMIMTNISLVIFFIHSSESHVIHLFIFLLRLHVSIYLRLLESINQLDDI